MVTVPESHPELETERGHLAQTVQSIHDALQRLESPSGAGIDAAANRAVDETRRQRAAELADSLDRPYFGRLDLLDPQQNLQTLYFGPCSLDISSPSPVVSWKSPVYELYVRGQPGPQTYRNARGQPVQAGVVLKRAFVIESRELRHMQDDFDLRPDAAPKPAGKPAGPVRDNLLAKLEERRTAGTKAIYETVQKAQYELIRMPEKLALIINGVAGSGKTVIAYHRLAYLLYPERLNELQEHKTIVFAPSNLFLSYIKGLMPELGHRRITQTTFVQWAQQRLRDLTPAGLEDEFTVEDGTIRRLLDPDLDRDIKNRLWNRSRLKGRLEMERLLARYAQWLARRLEVPEEVVVLLPLLVEGQRLVLRVARERVLALHVAAASAGNTLHEQRQAFRKFLIQALEEEARRRLSQAGERWSERTGEAVGRELERWAGEFLAKAWPRVNARRALEQLFSSPDLLLGLGHGLFKEADLETLAWQPAPLERGRRPGGAVVAAEDLPALLCLAQFLYEPIPQRYDHIVIDEGQDWSPLQYRLLASLSANGSMTIVGDIAQSIYGYRGVTSWDEVRDALQPFPVEIHRVRTNYRSTEPIVRLANQVLQSRFKGKAEAAEAVERGGPEPVFRRVSPPGDLAAAVAREATALGRHHATVAVIVKLPAEKEQLVRQLSALGVAAKALELPGTYAERDLEGVLVVSADEAKGLEFDAVVIADASESVYSGRTPFDGSLLYVALSRALHHLSILYTGRLTGYIAAPVESDEPF